MSARRRTGRGCKMVCDRRKAPTIYAVNPFEQSQSYIKGDVNEDGKVEISDLRLILRSVCKKVELTEQQKLAADVTERRESRDR